MTVTITIDDLTPFAPGIPQDKADAMIKDAMAMARLIAPCIDDVDFAYADQAEAIIKGAIIRWHESGQGVLTGRTALGFSQTLDTRIPRRSMYLDSEIADLKALCSVAVPADKSSAWGYDTLGTGTLHDDVCALTFGANYCSCGADIAGTPIYGVAP
jgi:hypothetical protein